MNRNDIKEMITRTKPCEDCKGKGLIKENPCKICNGSGVVFDNYIGDEILKATAIKRSELATLTTLIYGHFKNKLLQAYERGYEDGKEHKKIDEVA